jgi:release factor glutamine methyltransferase
LLRQKQIDSAWLDALLLLRQAVNDRLDKTALITAKADDCLSEDEALRFQELIMRRAAYEPVAYLTEQCEFMGLPFKIKPGVLVPRCDTETLAEAAIDWIRRAKAHTLLELCTGSGCVGIATAYYCETLSEIVLSDIDTQALTLARRNANQLLGSRPVAIIQSDLTQAIPRASYDVVLANPPYIAADEYALLPPSVKNYEPITALRGGTDGLDFYRRIAAEAQPFMTPGGVLLLEIGFDQSGSVGEILRQAGFVAIEIKKDLAGRDRVISCRYKEKT